MHFWVQSFHVSKSISEKYEVSCCEASKKIQKIQAQPKIYKIYYKVTGKTTIWGRGMQFDVEKQATKFLLSLPATEM